MSTSSLYHFIKSFGSRIANIDELSCILIKNCNAIQYFINTQQNVCNNYYNIFTITQITIITQYLITGTFKIHKCGKYFKIHP
jgi:hypothetical protein